MIIKCKMCGGDITFTPGETYGTCEYCGSTSTIPKAEDEQKLNRYNRANHFRRQCEFDKALAAYEKILEQDDTDAEAHWGAVLSRYGIEYVEDPASKKRIPTCHRVQITSILADADYLAAVEYAPDAESRRLYGEQAAQIAEIQKGILVISANEKPYDVFICYKETDTSGQRTHDSQWAQDVYYGLTDAGYKVFFSRITLEDKLGQQYEPYIFAALNSAKVMVVIGSKPEYFNAVWVKNEWSRYLALMANDRKRLLIPCYRNMDPYDLPEELSTLQSQDMSKIGFMQDLLRGVKKVLEANKVEETAHAIPQVVKTSDEAAPGVTSLMERAYLFMEDGDFASASEYLNRVLDIDPKYAPAYAAKACVAFGMRKESDLASATFLYEDNTDWQKATRFADGAQKARYKSYIAKVRERVNLQIRGFAYDCAITMAVDPHAERSKLDAELATYENECLHSTGKRADGSRRENGSQNEEIFKEAVSTKEPGKVSEEGFKAAAEMFHAIQDSEASARAEQCLALAEQARQQKLYLHAFTKRCKKQDALSLEAAARIFQHIPDYKDALAQAQKCLKEAEAARNGMYTEALELMKTARAPYQWDKVIRDLNATELDGYRDVEELRVQAKEQRDQCIAAKREKERLVAATAARRKKRTTVLVTLFIVLTLAMIYIVTQIVIPKGHYDAAVEYRKNGQWEEAVAAFAQAGSYSDAETQVFVTYYLEGETKRNVSDWEGAVTAFANAGSYSDAETQVSATYYVEGMIKRAARDWEGAVTAYTNAGSYSDAATQVKETYYQQAQALMNTGDHAGARKLFLTIRGYKDVDSLLASNENLVAARDAMFSVGSYVTFGTYPQTAEGNDETPIEWLVLDRDGNKALLLSRYGLDAQPYNERYTAITWENCTLRTWLNNEFLNCAFSAEEQSAILLTNVDNSSSQGYSKWGTSGGNNTQDQMFLLSYAEANKYLGATKSDDNNTQSRVAPTAFAIAQGAHVSDSKQTADGEVTGYWWLRSPGYKQSRCSYVLVSGALFETYVYYDYISVRPALWVNFESGIF